MTACQINSSSYVKFAYLFILIGAGIHLFEDMLVRAGYQFTSLADFGNLAAFLGLLQALVGYSVLRGCMQDKDLRHLKYVLVIFLAVFVIYGIIALLMGGSPIAVEG